MLLRVHMFVMHDWDGWPNLLLHTPRVHRVIVLTVLSSAIKTFKNIKYLISLCRKSKKIFTPVSYKRKKFSVLECSHQTPCVVVAPPPKQERKLFINLGPTSRVPNSILAKTISRERPFLIHQLSTSFHSSSRHFGA